MADDFIGYGIEPDIPEEDMLRKSIMAELDAINLYRRFAQNTRYSDLKEVFNHVADEEEEHFAEFLTALEKIRPDFVRNMRKGEREVEEIIQRHG